VVKDTRKGLPPPPAGLADDPTTRAANAIHSAALRLLRRARTADTEMDLDGPRASALSVLVFGGPVPLGRLAEIEQVSPPAITKTVTALEAAGLATRTRSERDRRVVLVAATDAGRELLERGRAARVLVIADLIGRLPDADVAALQRAAELLGTALAAAHPAAPDPAAPDPDPAPRSAQEVTSRDTGAFPGNKG
jgi:DNA-binding MarR family transcriptional regulator